MKSAVRTMFVIAIGLIALQMEQGFLDRVHLHQRFNYYCLGVGYPSG